MVGGRKEDLTSTSSHLHTPFTLEMMIYLNFRQNTKKYSHGVFLFIIGPILLKIEQKYKIYKNVIVIHIIYRLLLTYTNEEFGQNRVFTVLNKTLWYFFLSRLETC